jgi:hypothetical protein
VDELLFSVSTNVPIAADLDGHFWVDNITVERFGKHGVAIFKGRERACCESVALSRADKAHDSGKVTASAFTKGRGFVVGEVFGFRGGEGFG